MATNPSVLAPADSAEQSNLPGQKHADATGRARLALRVATAALIFALPLELLLRAEPGINLALSGVCVALALMVVTRARGGAWHARAGLCVVLIALASIAAVRGPSMLWLAMAIGMIATVVVLVVGDGSALRSLDPYQAVFRVLDAIQRTLAGPFWLVARHLDLSTLRPSSPTPMRHLRGFAWSVPVVIPFLLLFSAADPAFAAILGDVVDLPNLASHVFLWGVLAWLGTGWLGVAAFPPTRPVEERGRLDAGDGIWVLGVLAVAFSAFVAVQFRYFFGGGELVQQVAGLSYAEYARRGFFELVTVAALLLVVLLLIDWLTRDATRPARRRLGGLGLLLIALLAVILVSALQRMLIYVDQYGLTQLRFFTTAFMLWLVVVFAWYCATVLRAKRDRFVGGVYVAGVAAVLVLAAIDPIGRIAAFNVEHAGRTGRFDTQHMISLESDAVPTLVGYYDRLPEVDRCPVARALLRQVDAESGWRSWNLSRERARASVLPHVTELRSACPPTSPTEGATR